MIISIISFLIALTFRILIGYLATEFKFLGGWFIWVINALVIVLALVVLAFIVRKFIDIFSGVKRKNKKGGRYEQKEEEETAEADEEEKRNR